jgi:hypothetical protein
MAMKLPHDPGEIVRKNSRSVQVDTLRGRAARTVADRTHRARRKIRDGQQRAAARKILQDRRCVLGAHSAARFDVETAKNVLTPQIKKIAPYVTA